MTSLKIIEVDGRRIRKIKLKKILITGVAGFVGFSLAKQLFKKKKYRIIGIDSFNDYYDKQLKLDRIKELKKINNKIIIIKDDLQSLSCIKEKLRNLKFNYVYHLAAQAGVRHSLKNPQDYINNNLIAFFTILELCKDIKVKNLIFSSTSGVYGEENKIPYSEENSNTNKPIQFYAATKKSNEIMAYSYSRIYNLPITVVRLFTVYGPWGRPDMALFIFVKRILENKTVELFNYGNHERSFSYIDDVINGLILFLKNTPKNKIRFNIYNIGGNNKIKLKKYLSIIEKNLKIKVKIKFSPLQIGDVKSSVANITKIKKIGFKPKVPIEIGVKKFIDWYKSYYQKKK
jgi:UDP-glucuronate 4-epimerase